MTRNANTPPRPVEAPPNPQLLAESLACVTGIFPTSAPSQIQQRLAVKLPERLAARVRAFLDADKPEKFKWEKPIEQKELYAKITEPFDHDAAKEWLVDLPPEISLPYVLTVQAARDKVRTSWPVYPDPSLGLHNFDLAPDEYMDVCQVLRTLDSVESIFDDLDAHVLLPEQVELFATIYPDLCQAVQQATYDALQPYIEIPGIVEKKKNLSELKEEQIRVLLRLPTDAPIAAPQGGSQVGNQQDGSSPKKSTSEDDKNLQTPSEHTAARRVAT